jgi:hypothetical protein
MNEFISFPVLKFSIALLVLFEHGLPTSGPFRFSMFYLFIHFLCPFFVSYSREFTHRVKSVSMAKFTSQEVEALQNGGNQVQC